MMWDFLFVQTGQRGGILYVANVERLKYVHYKIEYRKADWIKLDRWLN